SKPGRVTTERRTTTVIKSFILGAIAGGAVMWFYGEQIRETFDDATSNVRTRTAERMHNVADTLQSVADTVDQGLTGTPHHPVSSRARRASLCPAARSLKPPTQGRSDMKRFALALVLVLATAAVGMAAERHSGSVLAVDAAGGTLQIRELVEG